jgi:hypothetical protein
MNSFLLLCGTLSSSLFHVSLSGHCCSDHRVGVVISPEGCELAVSDPEDEREIAVVGPAGRHRAQSHDQAPRPCRWW